VAEIGLTDIGFGIAEIFYEVGIVFSFGSCRRLTLCCQLQPDGFFPNPSCAWYFGNMGTLYEMPEPYVHLVSLSRWQKISENNIYLMVINNKYKNKSIPKRG